MYYELREQKHLKDSNKLRKILQNSVKIKQKNVQIFGISLHQKAKIPFNLVKIPLICYQNQLFSLQFTVKHMSYSNCLTALLTYFKRKYNLGQIFLNSY